MILRDPDGREYETRISRRPVGGFLVSSLGLFGVKDPKSMPRWEDKDMDIVSATEQEKAMYREAGMRYKGL